jgi:hypothetical protein
MLPTNFSTRPASPKPIQGRGLPEPQPTSGTRSASEAFGDLEVVALHTLRKRPRHASASGELLAPQNNLRPLQPPLPPQPQISPMWEEFFAEASPPDSQIDLEAQIRNLDVDSQRVIESVDKSVRNMNRRALADLFTAFERLWGLKANAAQAQEFVNALPSLPLRVSLSQDPSPLSISKLLSHSAKLKSATLVGVCDTLIKMVAANHDDMTFACQILKYAYKDIWRLFGKVEAPMSPRSEKFAATLERLGGGCIKKYKQLRFSLPATQNADFPESKRHPPLDLVIRHRAQAYYGPHPEHPISQHLPRKYQALLEASWTTCSLVAGLHKIPQNPYKSSFNPDGLSNLFNLHKTAIRRAACFEAAKSLDDHDLDAIVDFMRLWPEKGSANLNKMAALTPSHQDLVFYLGGTEKSLTELEVMINDDGVEEPFTFTPCLTKEERTTLLVFVLQFEKIFGRDAQQTPAQRMAAVALLPPDLHEDLTNSYVGLDNLLLCAAHAGQDCYDATCESFINQISCSSYAISKTEFLVVMKNIRENILELGEKQNQWQAKAL